MLRRIIFVSILGFVFLMNHASAKGGFESGIHYETLSRPVVTANPKKIEVIELFWYGCPHCDALDPSLKKWVSKLPEDVYFTQMPVVFGRSWEMHARMFVVAKNLDLMDDVHDAVFNALHREGQRLQDEAEVVAFFERFGADPKIVRRELKGFSTESALRLSDARVRAYGIRGVPALVVNGRYVTGVAQAGSESKLFELLDFLIEKSRSQ
ncbi:thiol:disulfide interchange protein DsbA/DsbL [Litorivicinus sp.]|jgi:thiol:disulfide interchange protein DsbA|nr:thiol:disulfide interchange protein DsbA/DsbL [Litorivicinus sp.]